ncbi:MAG: hypothetical protein JSS79_06065 [Bacteroidetes bacterium]|nr:hypothetical protein [Bacteroidota bacterium]
MLSFQFWKSWRKPDQIIFWILAAFVFVALIFFWQGWWISPAPVIANEHFQQIQKVQTATHSFQVGLLNLGIPADSYVILENIFGSHLHPNAFASYVFLAALMVAFLFFVAIISTFSRFWFLIGMGLVMLFLASLRLEALEVFGFTNKAVVAVAILLFGGLSFYFHSFKKESGLALRLVAFAALMAGLGVIIYFFSKATTPFLHLSVNGLLAGIILTIIFIVMVAHEIVASFVTITTESLRSSKSLQHFLILTVVYLINVALMFASKMGFIQWSFFSISSFFLLMVSAILGLWGFRKRSHLYEHILPTEPIAVFFFFTLMLVSFGAMGYFASSASDMMMDALDDLIMAAHIGAGIIFTLYVIANFGPMLRQNLAVHKVLYKPETMPHFTYRLMSVIAAYAVLSVAVSWKTYVNQATATYYHAYGDLYLLQNDDVTAEGYYQKSLQFRNQNLHAHYALATISARQYDSFKERTEYEKTITWSPSIPVYLNLSQAYAIQNDLLEAALTLDAGKKIFPKSGELQNAIGLSFLKLGVRDSALYSFQLAKNLSGTKSVGATNYLGACAIFNVEHPVDSLLSFDGSQTNGVAVNATALANLQHKSVELESKLFSDTALSVYQAALLCNYLINKGASADTALVRQVIQLAARPVNDDFKEQLTLSAAQALYANGDVKEALQLVRDVAYRSGDGSAFSLLGLWLMEQNNPSLAATYFKLAAEKMHPHALYYQALAETESDSLRNAIASWDSLRKANEKEVAAFAEKMSRVLNSNIAQAGNLSEEEKYYFCRYRIALNDSVQFLKTVNSIGEPSLNAQAFYDRAKKWFALDEPDKALYQLRQIASINNRMKTALDEFGVLLSAEKRNMDFIKKKLSSGTELSAGLKMYVDALLAEESGNGKLTRERYVRLASANNQFEEGVVASARFLANDTTERLKNFSLLVDGLLAKPNSVKILKQHVLESIALGFEQAAQDSLDKLHALLPEESFKKFIAAHREYFSVEKK